jgi:hypothetical protein
MNITLKKIILTAIVIALAVFLFKNIAAILAVLSITLIAALNWVIKGLVVIGAIFLVMFIFKKQ